MRLMPAETEEAQFQMAPMIDMVFLLLVFFMCASHLSQSKNIKLEMPLAARGVVPKERPDRWTINITADGELFSGMNPVIREELGAMIVAAREENPALKVYLRADAATPHREVRKVMGIMAEAGIDDFIFGVYTPSGGGNG